MCRLTFKIHLFLCFLCVGQQSRNDSHQWQECAHLENELHAGLVGQPSEEGRSQSPQSKHQSEEHAGDHPHLVGHEVGGVNHDRRECRCDDQSREEAAHDGHREAHIGHGQGEGGRSEDGEPNDIFPAEPVAQHATCHRSDGERGEKHKEEQLRSLYRHAKLVDQEEREVARDARGVEIFREHEEHEYCQRSVFGPFGDVVVQRGLSLRMLHHILHTGLIPCAEPHHDQGGEQGGQGKPRDGVLAVRQDDDGRQQGSEGRSAVAAHLEDRLRQTLLAARRHLRYARCRGVEHRRSEAHDAHGDEYGEVMVGEGQCQEARQREAHAHGEGVRAWVAVGVQAGERLQDRRGHLKHERDDAYLCEGEVELVFQDGINGGNDRLYHVVQEMRYAAYHEYGVGRSLGHGGFALELLADGFDLHRRMSFYGWLCKSTHF